MTKETAVAKKDSFQVPALAGEMAEAFREEMDGLSVEFDRVKIPAGGGMAFEVPGETEEVDYEKELVGVIVDHHPVNSYWPESMSGENNPPDCSSNDGKVGIGDPGGECATCYLNKWGSGKDGKGKACKNMHRVYVLREGEMFPLLLTLPPTSIRNFSGYMAKRIVGKGRRSFAVITRVTLKKVESGSGHSYSQAQFVVVGSLDSDAAEAMQAYSDRMKRHTRDVDVATDEYIEGTEIKDDDTPF